MVRLLMMELEVHDTSDERVATLADPPLSID